MVRTVEFAMVRFVRPNAPALFAAVMFEDAVNVRVSMLLIVAAPNVPPTLRTSLAPAPPSKVPVATNAPTIIVSAPALPVTLCAAPLSVTLFVKFPRTYVSTSASAATVAAVESVI